MIYDIEFDQDIFLPIYWDINSSDADIKFFYGGRDSGKSYNIAANLVMECLESDYFKCVMARKTYNSIKESQYELIKSFVTNHGLDDLFDFSKSHPLSITCANGNRFIARGCDNPENIKSITEPTHCWYEEGNQLTQQDYTTVSTTLRSSKGLVKEYFSFNPECDGDFREFWLYKDFFSHTTEKSFTWTKTVETPKGPVFRKVQAIHSTYLDNRFCTPDRSAKLEDLKFTAPYYYRVYCLGEWGVRENKSPFVVTFDRARHLGTCERVAGMPIYLSFDFNRNPMACSIIQYSGNKVRWLEVIKMPNSNIDAMCEQIKLRYPGAIFIACGDFAGTQRSGLIPNTDMNSYWKRIKANLRLTDGQLQYIVNPSIEENQVLLNHCLHHLDVVFDKTKCQPAIFDLEFAETMANGKLKKGDRNDAAQQLDVLDTIRYFFNRYFGHLIRQTGYKK